VKKEEQIGRITGDKNWREQRGELGANADAKARALDCSETAPVPGSWVNSAENYSLKDGMLIADLRRADGSWNRGVKVTVELGGSYSNQDGNFKLENETVHKLANISSNVDSSDYQTHESLAVHADLEKLTISCRWKDQGWGNQKGQIRLVLTRGTDKFCHDCFGVAPHDWEQKEKTFSASDLNNPRKEDLISIEYFVGGHSSHELHVEDLKVSLTRKPSQAAASSGGGYSCTTPPTLPTVAETPAPVSTSPDKQELQKLVKKAFDELVASGMSANEAGAQAIKKATKEHLQVLTKKIFAELVATGMTPTEAAATALEQAKKRLS